jgi:hypothetical protein
MIQDVYLSGGWGFQGHLAGRLPPAAAVKAGTWGLPSPARTVAHRIGEIHLLRITTVVVCALTSNLHVANEPGNVLLEEGEGNLPRQSVVVVSQISSVEKARLGSRIGSLTEARVEQILDGPAVPAGFVLPRVASCHMKLRVCKADSSAARWGEKPSRMSRWRRPSSIVRCSSITAA